MKHAFIISENIVLKQLFILKKISYLSHSFHPHPLHLHLLIPTHHRCRFPKIKLRILKYFEHFLCQILGLLSKNLYKICI